MSIGDPAPMGDRRGTGCYLYGVRRARGWRQRDWPGAEQRLARVRFRELEAVVAQVPFDLPELGAAELAAHQRAGGIKACRCTILPAPPGVIFSGRRSLARFLDDQYLTLIEGLTLLEGHWEFRLHIERSGGEAGGGNAASETARLYADLRRRARAAVSFPRRDGRLLSVAFLVERQRWIDFVEEAEELGSNRPDLVLDLTGPWPPYDFVKLVA
jgi:hypothetical protein